MTCLNFTHLNCHAPRYASTSAAKANFTTEVLTLANLNQLDTSTIMIFIATAATTTATSTTTSTTTTPTITTHTFIIHITPTLHKFCGCLLRGLSRHYALSDMCLLLCLRPFQTSGCRINPWQHRRRQAKHEPSELKNSRPTA